MRPFLTLLGLIFCSVSFGQNCFCGRDTTLNEVISCDTINFDNSAKLYWNFNCDSSWLTFESPKHVKDIIFSMELVGYTGKLGFSYAQEYKHKFLIKNRVISGCCAPPDFFLFDKTSGQIEDSLGRVIFYSSNKSLPFIIGLTGSNYDTTLNDYNSLTIYNVDRQKKYFIAIPKGEINKALDATGKEFPEYLFDEPVLKGTTISLTYLLSKPRRNNIRRTKTITIDLKKYSR